VNANPRLDLVVINPAARHDDEKDWLEKIQQRKVDENASSK
jgi:hypothetical protein